MLGRVFRSQGMWLCAGVIFAASAFAAPIITVDENGNGFSDATRLTFRLGPDIGPGGLSSVLIYNLGVPTTVVGDVGLTAAEGVFDFVRFNGNGTLIFYSDNVPVADSIGDTPSPPLRLYANLRFVPEIGPEGNNGAFYTPGPNDPGFIPGASVTYHFVSDGVVPEPSSIFLLLSGAGLLGLLKFRARK